MRKLTRREKALLGLLAVAVLAVGTWAWRQSDAGPAVLGRTKPSPPPAPVPRIDLARIDAPHGESPAGRRDLFEFGAADWTAGREDVPIPRAAPTPPSAGAAGGGEVAASGPTTPGLAPLNLKYIGSVESRAGVKVAVLVTDRKEVLTGQPGEVVANRYRIARIGLESVDLEDVHSGQARRIPLRGN